MRQSRCRPPRASQRPAALSDIPGRRRSTRGTRPSKPTQPASIPACFPNDGGTWRPGRDARAIEGARQVATPSPSFPSPIQLPQSASQRRAQIRVAGAVTMETRAPSRQGRCSAGDPPLPPHADTVSGPIVAHKARRDRRAPRKCGARLAGICLL